MILQDPGKVTDRITMLGRRESALYHLDGKSEAVLLGGGMVHVLPDVLGQLETFNIDEKKIGRLVVLHSHFDHCGVVDFLKKRWPWMRVAASPQAKNLLAKPKVIEAIRSMNQALIDGFHRRREMEKLGVDDFDGITVEDVLSGGQKVAAGDRTLEIIDVPGHSSCSIAVYVPEEKALFTSDAAGIAVGDEIFTAANQDFDQYQQSLEKMAAYEVDVQLAEHYGARTGKDAMGFIEKSKAAAERYRRMAEALLEKTGDPEQSAREMTEITMNSMPSEFLPAEIVSLIHRQMIAFIDKKRQSGG